MPPVNNLSNAFVPVEIFSNDSSSFLASRPDWNTGESSYFSLAFLNSSIAELLSIPNISATLGGGITNNCSTVVIPFFSNFFAVPSPIPFSLVISTIL